MGSVFKKGLICCLLAGCLALHLAACTTGANYTEEIATVPELPTGGLGGATEMDEAAAIGIMASHSTLTILKAMGFQAAPSDESLVPTDISKGLDLSEGPMGTEYPCASSGSVVVSGKPHVFYLQNDSSGFGAFWLQSRECSDTGEFINGDQEADAFFDQTTDEEGLVRIQMAIYYVSTDGLQLTTADTSYTLYEAYVTVAISSEESKIVLQSALMANHRRWYRNIAGGNDFTDTQTDLPEYQCESQADQCDFREGDNPYEAGDNQCFEARGASSLCIGDKNGSRNGCCSAPTMCQSRVIECAGDGRVLKCSNNQIEPPTCATSEDCRKGARCVNSNEGKICSCALAEPAYCGDGRCDPDENKDICKEDCSCNFNGTCEPLEGENWRNCGGGFPGDGIHPAHVGDHCTCGDGTCNPDEVAICPADCWGDGRCDKDYGESPNSPDCSTCGNGKCEAGETCSTCQLDCGWCKPQCDCAKGECDVHGNALSLCENGVCEGRETREACPADCGAPPLTVTCGDSRCDIGEENWSSDLFCPADCPFYNDCSDAMTTNCCGNMICDIGENILTCPKDCSLPACGDSLCERRAGEDRSSCAKDCAYCGDGICDKENHEDDMELPTFCPKDCPPCGNGTCEAEYCENATTCPQDCPQPSGRGPVCGNGRCERGEDYNNCSADCGAAPLPQSDATAGMCNIGQEAQFLPPPLLTESPLFDGDVCAYQWWQFAAWKGDGICEPNENIKNSFDDCKNLIIGSAGICDRRQGETRTLSYEDCHYCGDGICDSGIQNHPEDSSNCPRDCPFFQSAGGAVCGNGRCERGEEDSSQIDKYCPADCGAGPPPCGDPNESGRFEICSNKCGDGVCDSANGETDESCHLDCHCGNGFCDMNEDLYSCPDDCKSCRFDSICESYENENRCPYGDCSFVISGSCGNGFCEERLHENWMTCPGDCQASEASCGDYICQRWEYSLNCPQDCPSQDSPASCGDAICQSWEDSWTCPRDCPWCGDGICGLKENFQNCPYDCHYCGDGVCEDIWEDDSICPRDCP